MSKKIVFDFKDDINIEGDKGRISQVVSNLLSNSIKFTEEEGDILISVERKKEGNKNIVVVSVKDTGTGIDSEILPRLFTKFASKSEIGGTGLGLYISKSIIDAHRGKIWYENNMMEKEQLLVLVCPWTRGLYEISPFLLVG